VAAIPPRKDQAMTIPEYSPRKGDIVVGRDD
jgi:hypothetical protein